MASPTALKRKRCRRGGRKKKVLSENPEIPASEPKWSDEVGPSSSLANKAVGVLRKRRRKRCRSRNNKILESKEVTPSEAETLCNPGKLSTDSPVTKTTENTGESRLSTSDLQLRPPKRRKRKRKTKHIPSAHNVDQFVAVTAIQEILIGDIVMFQRMVLKDCQPHLETITAKVFLKMKYGDQSSTDHDTLLIRPLIDAEPGIPHHESGHMGEPEFLKFEEMAEVLRKLAKG